MRKKQVKTSEHLFCFFIRVSQQLKLQTTVKPSDSVNTSIPGSYLQIHLSGTTDQTSDLLKRKRLVMFLGKPWDLYITFFLVRGRIIPHTSISLGIAPTNF